MHGDDVLGDDGRKALNACVKVNIYGKPETRRYDRETAVNRLSGCYSSCNPVGNFWLGHVFDKYSSETYNIVDIHDALVNFDKRKSIEKYPKEGPESVKQRELIDKRRAGVEREHEKAIADPDGRIRYSWVVAQRRVRACFAGNFTEDRWMLLNGNDSSLYNIEDIYRAFSYWEEVRKRAEAQRTAVEEEYAKAKTAEENGEYSKSEAAMCVMDVELRFGERPLTEDDVLPVKTDSEKYDIFDIYKASVKFDGKRLEKYPEEGSGSDKLKELIDQHRADLEEEYKESRKSGIEKWYSSWQADRRVRDCFSGTFPSDTEIFPKEEKDKNDLTYDIFDIKEAVDHFDAQTFLDICKYASKGEPDFVKINQKVDEERVSIQEEYDEATRNIEIEHGSGFVIHDHFVITNKHVIETYLDDTERHNICISNAAISISSEAIYVSNEAIDVSNEIRERFGITILSRS